MRIAATSRAVLRRRVLHPGAWPLRWRLAAVSAGLTLVLLMLFGAVIGGVATQRIRDDFNREVSSAVQILASEFKVEYPAFGPPRAREGPRLNDFVLPDDAAARVLDINGDVRASTRGSAHLGPPKAGISDHDGIRVAMEPIVDENGTTTGYVQYGRSVQHVSSTIDRLWLFIAGGVLLGTLLAIFAGLAIARRAMRPIASLTATAREIATTRDPSRQMPRPAVEDEIGELALTLEQMLRSLDAARAEREGTMKKQREFVADASHELRTPLTSVLANLELLQASLAAPGHDEDREIVDSALRSSRRMSRLVGDLLLLARADAGRLDKHRRCDLAEVAGDAAAEAAPLLGDRTLTIENERPLRVEGSPDELHRMVLNLLDNAAHHTPAGATIDLSLREEDGDAVVEVADDGPGIPAAMREQIFDRFVRGEGPADTTGGTGTGLGLAIVSAVTASHGGKVEATESESGGALFRIRIPLADSEQVVTRPLKAL
ncbi:MAG: two-component system, OmpR family, sensor kinase [Solirubrobacterales bacterium]|nr:two-component system, OmpR family, sensor kinase [Solirubrobacterales bacterium]